VFFGSSMSTSRLSPGVRPVDGQTAALRIVVLACGISAGVHAALIPEHFSEGTPAGAGFLAAAVLLGALAVALTISPTNALALTAAAAVFAGLIGSYAFAVTTGLPVLHPEVESLDGVALLTKAVELIGLAALMTLLPRRSLGAVAPQPKGS
jgi:hypothetical protein